MLNLITASVADAGAPRTVPDVTSQTDNFPVVLLYGMGLHNTNITWEQNNQPPRQWVEADSSDRS